MRTLEDTLTEITPTPDPDFVADMEERMKLGFPPKKPPRFVRPTLNLPSFRVPAFAGAAASALLALMVSLAIVNNASDQPGDKPTPPDQPVAAEAKDDGTFLASPTVESGSGGGEAREGGASSAQDLAQNEVVPGTALPEPIPPDGDVAPGRRDRKVEQTAQLSLAADTGDFDQIADSVFAIAQRRNGFVLRSSFTEGEEGASSGFFELRVPSAQLQSTLNELSRIATVRSRSESGTDVTGSFVAARVRLQIARAERKSLLTRLETAPTEQAAAALRQRLQIVAGEINGLRSQLRGMRERTKYAAVSVELFDEDAGPSAAKTETDKAVDDAVGSLEDILNFLIRALGILVPVMLAGAVGWFAASRMSRRRREQALA
jgi:hypothetical protein